MTRMPPHPLNPHQSPNAAGHDEVLVRLARLDEQMRHVAAAMEKLAIRDAEIETSLRGLSDRFSSALSDQADAFRDSLKDITERFVSREDWAFWKNLLTAALLAMMAYGWHALIGSVGQRP